MWTSPMSLGLLQLFLLCLVNVNGQEITPKCCDTVIAKIKAYYAKYGYPPSIAVNSKTWTVLEYSVEIPWPVCVKQEVGSGQVLSTLLNTQTNAVAFTSTVTFTGDVKEGLVVQTVKGTGETIHFYSIKSTPYVNVFYFCSPYSKLISDPQGGVAAPICNHSDKATIEEVKNMKKILAKMGITTYAITPCKK